MFTLSITIIIIMFAIDLSLSVLNYGHRKKAIPANVADIYNREDYNKWLNYTMEVFRMSIIKKVFDTLLLLAFLGFGVFPRLAAIANGWTDHPILQTLLFLGLFSAISYLLGIGFSIYATFNIEERYGFNKSTVKTFISDQIKSIIFTAVLGGGLLFALLKLYMELGNMAIFYGWGLVTLVILAFNLLYTKVFIKLFNKLTPLTEGELFDGVKALATKTGYEVKNISVMDASKRSARLNAFFSGFGRFKQIILFDTLVDKCSRDEILSVLAHEIGHSKHRDVLRNFFISIIQIGIYLALVGFFLNTGELAIAFGFTGIHYGFAIILFGILMEPVAMLAQIPLAAMSRKAEYRADAFAAAVGYKEAMISALKILSRENFSNLTPHPLLVKMTYSHPPVSDRISALEKL